MESPLQAFVGRDEPGALVLGFESGCGATPMVDIALGQVLRTPYPYPTLLLGFESGCGATPMVNITLP